MPSQPAPAAQPETPPATPDTHPIPPYSTAMDAAWRTEFARETEKRYGIPAAQIEAVLAQAQMRDAIVKAMSRPAEAKPWRDYRPIFSQPKRTDDGRAFLARHRDALARAERGGAERAKVRSWRQWAESELRFERENRVASRS